MNRNLEFTVSGLVDEGPTEFLHVVGRCGDVALRIGDVFESMYRYSFNTSKDGSETATRIDPQPIRLEIKAITAYEHDLKELGSGMTGRLSLSGSGSDLVQTRCVLGLPISVAQDPLSSIPMPTHSSANSAPNSATGS
ncbi:MAG: hypothetical protein K8U03_11875 [Planctomycetia bacterium]|nr:hypothetical protein [Planctomycetia bacterium]